MSNMYEAFPKEMGDADKILKILKKLKKHMNVYKVSYEVSNDSGIGTSVRLKVKIFMEESKEYHELSFDVTDYESW